MAFLRLFMCLSGGSRKDRHASGTCFEVEVNEARVMLPWLFLVLPLLLLLLHVPPCIVALGATVGVLDTRFKSTHSKNAGNKSGQIGLHVWSAGH